jgi:branched-chain amino acid transport system substrate-binding protein
MRVRSALKFCVSIGAAMAMVGGLVTTVAVGSAATAGAATSSCHFSRPLKIVGMWDVKGEDPAAGNDFQNGLQLALKKINGSGGVCGQKVQFQRVPMSGVTPAQAAAAFKQVQEANPDIAIGAGGDTQSIGKLIATAGIPVISPDMNLNADYGGSVGSKWLYLISSTQSYRWKNATKFLVRTLGKKKVGIMAYTTQFGTVAAQAVTQQLKSMGLKACAKATIATYTPTTLTQQVLAMKPCNAIVDAAYPNVNALELRQALQNGITVPTMNDGGLTIAETEKLVTGSAIANSYSNADCNTLGTTKPMTNYRTAYEAAYGGTVPNYLSAITYDATLMAAAAAKKAGTFNKTAIDKAIGSIDFTGGICQKNYQSDGRHTLVHTNEILKFKTDGTWTKVASFTIPMQGKLTTSST